MSEPWYQTEAPSVADVKNILIKCQWEKESIFFDKLDKKKTITFVINNYLREYEEKYNSKPDPRAPFGSYRGYYSFNHRDFIDNCQWRMEEIIKKKAIVTLKYYLMKYWIEDRLYRPPSENYSAGLRYNNIKDHFNKMTQDN